MGCASSTPMVATAGSELLKTASHVADNVKENAEAAVEGVTHTLGDTIGGGGIGTAVTGITSDLAEAIKDGTEGLNQARHKIMESLHLEAPSLNKLDGEAKDAHGTDESSTSRAPTPTIDGKTDADSLKTSTPEPEIERALANSTINTEESAPTPEPTVAEFAHLSAEVAASTVTGGSTGFRENETDATATATAPATATATATATTVAGEQLWHRKSEQQQQQQQQQDQDQDQRRPNTTEWEKFADQLAHSRKFKPYESFAHGKNKFSVYQDYTSLRDKPGHYDGNFSDGNTLSSLSQSSLSSAHLTPANLTPASSRRSQREFAKLVACEQPASVSRASSRLSNATVRTFDYNPQRERVSLPITTQRAAKATKVKLSGKDGRLGSSTYRVPVVAEHKNSWVKPVDVPTKPVHHLKRLSTSKKSKECSAQNVLAQPPGRHSIELESILSMTPGQYESRSYTPDIKDKRSVKSTIKKKPKYYGPEPAIKENFKVKVPETPTTSPMPIQETTESIKVKGGNLPPSLFSPIVNYKNSLTSQSTPRKPRSALRSPKKETKSIEKSSRASTPGVESPSRASCSSSASSEEVVIRSTFHTPSTVSLSPDQVQIIKYKDTDVETTPIRIKGFQESTSTLKFSQFPYIQSSPSALRRASNTSFLSSSPTPSWGLRKDYGNKELRPWSKAELNLVPPSHEKSPSLPYNVQERCEICCNEYVIN